MTGVLGTLGFPAPKGDIVVSFEEARVVARDLPVAVKPVVGHKGIGVTADVRDASELEFALAGRSKPLVRTSRCNREEHFWGRFSLAMCQRQICCRY